MVIKMLKSQRRWSAIFRTRLEVVSQKCIVWGAILTVGGFSPMPALAWNQSPTGVDMGASECYSCTSNSSSTSNSGPSRREIREMEEEAARIERKARYDAVHNRATSAWERGDYPEALRILREQQALIDGPVVRADIANLERYLADQANIELGNNYNQQAYSARRSGDAALALKLYRQALATYPNPTAEYRRFVAELEQEVARTAKALEERLQREAEAAERERRHRPEVERLRTEARTLLDEQAAEALARLDAALKLLPDDAKTVGDRWLAQASLALHEARFDDAFEALQKAAGHGLDAAEVARWNSRVKEERNRQGAGVRNAFGELRQRLAAAPGGSDPGAQLRSIEHGSREALSSPVAEKNFLTPGRADRKMAGEGFDTPGTNSGTLVYPDKNNYRQTPPSALETHLPKEAKDNQLIQASLAWYRQLDGQKAETDLKIASVAEQLKNGTGDAAVLTAHLSTLKNRRKQIDADQVKTTETVKKKVKNLSLAWIESPADPPTTPAGRALDSPKGEAQSPPALDFIK